MQRTGKEATTTLGTHLISLHIKTAFRGVIKNSLMALASIMSCACCLFLYGLFMLLTLNVFFIGQQVQNQCEIQAYFVADLSQEAIDAACEKIAAIDNITETVFESKDEALQNYKEQLGEDASALDGLDGENFMRNSLKIRMKDISTVAQTVQLVGEIEGVEEVKNRQDIVDKILSINKGIRLISFIVMILLTFVSLLIIVNTIKLSVQSRANEIHIMKYVGATNWFVRWPFIIEGLIVGAFGGLLATLAVTGGYGYLISYTKEAMDIVKFYSVPELTLPLITILLFGIVMGGFGSFLAVRRHLDV